MDPKVLVVYCDGGSRGNPGPGAAAAIIKDVAGNKRFLCGKYLKNTTNNQAEYAAVELALKTINDNYPVKKDIQFFLDSKLVVNQLKGLYKVKDPNLRNIIFKIRQLEAPLGEIYYQHIGREENREADLLVNKVLDEGVDIQTITKLN